MTANAVTGSITALPATRAFGTQPLNQETAPLTVTVTNAGTAPVQLTISAISGSSFAKTTTCPAILTNVAGSNTCTIDVKFTPTTVGAKSESFTVAPSSGTVRTVTLTGTGTILVAPASLAFGVVSINTTNTLVTTVSNPGTQPLTINAVTFAGGGASQYVATTCAGGVVAAGGTCDVNVSLTPTSGGGKNATMTLDFGAAGTRNVSLTGSGATGSIQVNGATTATLAFGSQEVGTTSATQTVTVSNVGTGLLSITSIALGGANPGQYVIQSNTCTSPLAAGATCTVGVAFAPTNPTGAKPATLVVTPSSGTVRTVTLTGTAS
jgi:hypothetical protein